MPSKCHPQHNRETGCPQGRGQAFRHVLVFLFVCPPSIIPLASPNANANANAKKILSAHADGLKLFYDCTNFFNISNELG